MPASNLLCTLIIRFACGKKRSKGARFRLNLSLKTEVFGKTKDDCAYRFVDVDMLKDESAEKVGQKQGFESHRGKHWQTGMRMVV